MMEIIEEKVTFKETWIVEEEAAALKEWMEKMVKTMAVA
jgi:hypothetical protein